MDLAVEKLYNEERFTNTEYRGLIRRGVSTCIHYALLDFLRPGSRGDPGQATAVVIWENASGRNVLEGLHYVWIPRASCRECTDHLGIGPVPMSCLCTKPTYCHHIANNLFC